MTPRDDIFQRCIDLAHTSPHRTRVGCILLKKGSVVFETTNIYKSHPYQKRLHQKAGRDRPSNLHAELRALVLCRSDFDTLLVARVDKKGNVKMAMPCPTCSLAINERSDIKSVWFTNEYGQWENLDVL